MGPIEIIVIALAVLIFFGILGFLLWRKAKGKKTGCGCGDCAHCSACSAAKKKQAKKAKAKKQ